MQALTVTLCENIPRNIFEVRENNLGGPPARAMTGFFGNGFSRRSSSATHLPRYAALGK